jgi:acyl-CoA hydrolase
VNYTGRTSMEVGIRVDTTDIFSGESRHTNSCYFTMVAVDGNGDPVEVPALRPQDPVAVQRYESARWRRRAQRKQFESPHACEHCACGAPTSHTASAVGDHSPSVE